MNKIKKTYIFNKKPIAILNNYLLKCHNRINMKTLVNKKIMYFRILKILMVI